MLSRHLLGFPVKVNLRLCEALVVVEFAQGRTFSFELLFFFFDFREHTGLVFFPMFFLTSEKRLFFGQTQFGLMSHLGQTHIVFFALVSQVKFDILEPGLGTLSLHFQIGHLCEKYLNLFLPHLQTAKK